MRHTPASFDALLTTFEGRSEAWAFTASLCANFGRKHPFTPAVLAECGKLLAYVWRMAHAFRKHESDADVESAQLFIQTLEAFEGIDTQGSWLNPNTRSLVRRYMGASGPRMKLAASFDLPSRLYIEQGLSKECPREMFIRGTTSLWVIGELLAKVAPEEEATSTWYEPQAVDAEDIVGRYLDATIPAGERCNPYATLRARHGDYCAKVESFWPHVGDVGVDLGRGHRWR